MEKAGSENHRVEKSAAPETADKELPARKSKDKKRYEAEVRNRFFRQTQDLRRRIREIESGLERASMEVRDLETKLAGPEVYKKGENIADLVKSHGDLKKRVEALTAEWETLSLQLEEMERRREAELENPSSG